MISISAINQFIPLDKSWIIRMCLLDLIHGKEDRAISFLSLQENLGSDLLALKQSLEEWKSSKQIHVGESGTLYRLLIFINWKNNLGKEFVKTKTLEGRDICDNSEIVNWSQEELLKLDNGTSQWASAAALCGDKNRIGNPPFKLALTYEAIDEWSESGWKPRYDETIRKQAEAFVDYLKTGELDFTPTQSEDYCFARAFKLMDSKEGEERWPSLLGHESNRIEEMEEMIDKYSKGEVVDSNDHRVVQGIAMRAFKEGDDVSFSNPECVSKSWSQFWGFMEYCKKI